MCIWPCPFLSLSGDYLSRYRLGSSASFHRWGCQKVLVSGPVGLPVILRIPPTCPNRCTLAWLATLGCSKFPLGVGLSERCVCSADETGVCSCLRPTCALGQTPAPPPPPDPHQQFLGQRIRTDSESDSFDVGSFMALLGSNWKLRKGLAWRLRVDGCPRTGWRVPCVWSCIQRKLWMIRPLSDSLISPAPLSPTP